MVPLDQWDLLLEQLKEAGMKAVAATNKKL
jgi:hypothetical protein